MAGFTTIVAVLPVFLAGGLAIQLEAELGAGTAILGAAVAVYWGVSALLSALGGYLAQRLAPRSGMLLSVAIGLVALLGLAYGTPHWAWLFVWLAIGGAANALAHPVSNGFIVDQVAVQRRAFAFGLKQAAIPAATLTAGLSVPILALTVGWQWAYVGAAAGAVLLVVALALMVPHKSRSAAPETRTHRVGARLPRQLRTFLLATAMVSGMGSAAGNTLGAFTVSTAVDSGFAPGGAGLLLGLGSLAGCLVRPLVGLAADKGLGGSMTTVALMLATGAAGMLAMATGEPTAFAAGCVLAFGFGWGWNGLMHYVIAHRSHPYAAQATGISQSGTYIGSTVGPFAFGFIFTSLGSTNGWILAAVIASLGAVGALFASRLEKQL
ncbi:MFS transporter [Arthrobacter sp. ov118]|uniref:MFS transporter n=1 Tax=Arthrobacter sp. ov118 TaxID=1761747 RepID=UPI0015A5D234|nr:MFS transporter [Arthrobacter sp. ov118]